MDSYLPALNAANGLAPTAENIARISKQFGEPAAKWAFTQWSLRQRARAKFALAAEMFFTKNGLEQATHESVARYHASRFPTGALVADLTCGIGSDTASLATRGPVIGYEIDPVTAWCARRNTGQTIIEQDCLSADWEFEYAFADPSRRVGENRTLDPAAFSPNPMALALRLRDLKFAGMKLSPMLSDDFLSSLCGQVEFVSFAGECREAIAWFGIGSSGVTARKIESDAVLERSAGTTNFTDKPLAFLLEADPAAIRAHCLGTLCERHNALLLGDSNGYLTSDEAPTSDWLSVYRVIEEGRFDERRLRRILSGLGGGVPIIKSRGVAINSAKLARSLASPGTGSPIVVLFPVGKSIRYLVVETL